MYSILILLILVIIVVFYLLTKPKPPPVSVAPTPETVAPTPETVAPLPVSVASTPETVAPTPVSVAPTPTPTPTPVSVAPAEDSKLDCNALTDANNLPKECIKKWFQEAGCNNKSWIKAQTETPNSWYYTINKLQLKDNFNYRASTSNSSQNSGCYTVIHPGIIVNIPQLEFIKNNIINEPYKSAFEKMKNSPWGQINYKPKGPPESGYIECGAYDNPRIGCHEEADDGTAAVAQALLWYITGVKTYGYNSINILNKYANNMKGHLLHNTRLQVGGALEKFGFAAEIMRHVSNLWSDESFQKFKDMVRLYKSHIYKQDHKYNSNWELIRIDGLLNASIILDDYTTFTYCVRRIKEVIPATVYHKTDGGGPKSTNNVSTNWYGQNVFNSSTSGITQETCRDLAHAQMGISALFGILETLYIQGVNLYPLYKDRLVDLLEFHSRYLNGESKLTTEMCNNQKPESYIAPTMEIGYTAYALRMGIELPHTKKWLNKVRSLDYQALHNKYRVGVVFETLHHSGWHN